MKKCTSIVALSLMTLLLLPTNSVSAAGAELPENFKEIQNTQDPRMSLDDISQTFDSYQGKSVSYSYTEKQDNGDVYYYKGTLEYIGKSGLFGPYHYLGHKSDFTLYQIRKPDGSIITIKSLD